MFYKQIQESEDKLSMDKKESANAGTLIYYNIQTKVDVVICVRFGAIDDCDYVESITRQ